MSWSVPPGASDQAAEYQNETDRTAYERSFQTGNRQDALMAQALVYGALTTRRTVCYKLMPSPQMPPPVGYDRTEPGIMAAWDGDQEQSSYSLTDHGQDPAGRTSSMRPSMEASAP